jgi:hypothetical protein
MRLTPDQIEELRGKSPEGVYQHIRQYVRQEVGTVDRHELEEALRDAIDAGFLDERDLRSIEEE